MGRISLKLMYAYFVFVDYSIFILSREPKCNCRICVKDRLISSGFETHFTIRPSLVQATMIKTEDFGGSASI